MKRYIHTLSLIIFCILLAEPRLPAQENTAKDSVLSAIEQQRLELLKTDNSELEQRFDLRFKGGSVLDLVEATKDLPVNLIVPEDTDHVMIPKFEVNGVTDVELFSALNVLLYSDGPVRMQFDTGGKSSQKNRVWALSARPYMLHRPNNNQENKGLKVTTYPVSIERLLEEFSIDAVTTAIAQSVEIFQKSHAQITGEEIKPVNIAFHPETKLLILSGPEKSMTVATDTLKALFNGIDEARKVPPPTMHR